MANTPQTEFQSVLDHGLSVWSYTQRLLQKDTAGFRVSDWLTQNYDKILESLHFKDIVQAYNIFHDCGKPYCRVIEDGKQHFPNHAEVSAKIWAETFGDETIGRLISLDMLLHIGTVEEILNKNLSKEDYFTLLITALAELHSNAEMFGGIDSVSFKIKWKTIDKRGKMLVKEVLK